MAVSLDLGVVFAAGFSGGFGIFVGRGGQVEPLIVPGHTTEDGCRAHPLPPSPPTIAAFLRHDPLRELRERILEKVPRCGPSRVVHLVHGWPPHNHAGTELYARWLAESQSRHREVAVYARVAEAGRRLGEARETDDGGMRAKLLVNNFESNPRTAATSSPQPMRVS